MRPWPGSASRYPRMNLRFWWIRSKALANSTYWDHFFNLCIKIRPPYVRANQHLHSGVNFDSFQPTQKFLTVPSVGNELPWRKFAFSECILPTLLALVLRGLLHSQYGWWHKGVRNESSGVPQRYIQICDHSNKLSLPPYAHYVMYNKYKGNTHRLIIDD